MHEPGKLVSDRPLRLGREVPHQQPQVFVQLHPSQLEGGREGGKKEEEKEEEEKEGGREEEEKEEGREVKGKCDTRDERMSCQKEGCVLSHFCLVCMQPV